MPDQPNLAQPPTFPDQQDNPPMPVMATPPLDIPPIIANSQTPKKGKGKIIATILGILLLVGAVGAGVILVGQQQLFQQKAALAEPCKVCVGTQCKTIASPPACSPSLNECSPSSQCAAPTCDKEGDCDCTGNKSYRWFTDPVSKQCALKYDPSCVQECTPVPPPPPPTTCTLTGNEICVGNDITGPCYQGGQGGQYACYKLTGNKGKMVAGSGTQCKFTGGTSVNCNCPSEYPWRAFENGATWCFNTSTACDGEGCYAERCSLERQQCTGGTPTPVPTATPKPTASPTPTGSPTAPMCTTIKAYDTSWNPLSQAQLSALKPGNKVRFTISGTPADKIDKARFTINGVLGSEITTKKPGTNEYYVEYTIPPVVVSFNVTAQVHHLTLGWF